MNRTHLALGMTAVFVLMGQGALAWGAPPSSSVTPPTGTVWELQSLTVSGKTQPPPTALTRPTLSFDGRAVSGSGFCNAYRASYVSRADLLRFGATITTKKACVPILNILERQYLGLLSATTKYIVSGPNLTLYSGSRDRMLFTQKGRGPAASASEARAAPVAPVPAQTASPSGQIQTMMVNPAPALSQKGLPSARTIFDRATATLNLDEQLMVVAPQQADCVSVVPQRCLLVKRPAETVWSLFYGAIEGFIYQSGSTSLLRVRLVRLPRPAADGSTLSYRLVRVLGTQMALERVVARTLLKGTQWQLVTVNGLKSDIRPPVSFNIEGERLNLFDGCNGSGGQVVTTATTLRALGPQTSTARGCPKTLPLRDLFRRGASYQLLGRTLTLTGDGKIWQFIGTPLLSRPLMPRTPLKGTRWQLVTVNSRAVQTASPEFFEISNGKVTGSDGCNGFSADVSVLGSTVITHSPIISTQIGCAPFSRRPYVTDLLRRGATYQLAGRTLTLTGDGKLWKFIGIPALTNPPAQP